MNKLLIIGVIGIFLISFVSANIFTDVWDFFTGKDKEELKVPTWEKLGLNTTIFNTFNTKKNEIKILPVCLKTPENAKCKEKNPNYEPLDVSNTNYFYTNNQGVIRVKNE